jgi:hypothetical protein
MIYNMDNSSGLDQLDTGEWLVQQYINHDRMLHKVYVLGNDTTIISKVLTLSIHCE